MAHARLTIIGCGNPVRSDDGAGVIAATRLAEQASTLQQAPRVIAAQQLTPDLAENIASAAQVVFVDAYAADQRDAVLHVERIASGDIHPAPALDHHADPAAAVEVPVRRPCVVAGRQRHVQRLVEGVLAGLARLQLDEVHEGALVGQHEVVQPQ